MRRVLIVITVLVVAVAASGCRQILAHRHRAVTISDFAEPMNAFTDGENVLVTGTANDWGDTFWKGFSQCVGAPTTAADEAGDCTNYYGFSHYQDELTGAWEESYWFMRHIQTARSGWVDCALTACSLLVRGSGPYQCEAAPRPGCWPTTKPEDHFEVYQPVPITVLRTPESPSDCAVYAELVDTAGQPFTTREQCDDWIENDLASHPEVHATPATGLQDGQTIQVTGARMMGENWYGEMEASVQECVGTPGRNMWNTLRDCTAVVRVPNVYETGTFTIDYTVARHIETARGVVDCAVTTCSLLARTAGTEHPYVIWRGVSTPITFAP
jgi:hypothetical protein